jgi:iron(II)-dependent oxidoreductase
MAGSLPSAETTFCASELTGMLADARRRTLDLVADLSEEQLRVPLLNIINPPIWEMGHVAWFQEKWALRHLRGEPSLHPRADAFWDSIAIPHDDRWELPLPSAAETLKYMQDVLDRVSERLSSAEITSREAYFHWLVIMHEDMHGEAFYYTRQTLGYPAPWNRPAACPESGESVSGDIHIPGGRLRLGATPGELFVFDNEKWAHWKEVQPFSIARAPVTNAQFAEFVNGGGYRRREFWSDEGWAWREKERAEHPVYWIPDSGGRWLRRLFDQIAPIEENLPVIHVNWYEADAWCRWAGRRLPSEAEWEMAAAAELGDPEQKRKFPWGNQPPNAAHARLDGWNAGPAPVAAFVEGDSPHGCRQMIGNVWEWTATDFQPYPGFVVDPYKEYSEPWFGSDRKVLRGGCWATRSRLIRNTWRNFFTKDRRDVFAGFRTCLAS